MRVISLFDYTGNMLRPWAEAGYICYALDIQHQVERVEQVGAGVINFRRWDALNPEDVAAAKNIASQCVAGFGFPPCTDTAVSGSRHFKAKGLRRLAGAILLVAACIDVLAEVDGPAAWENPVSTISSYYRKPDYYFHPHQYTSFCLSDNYTKKTCIWANDQFVMPEPEVDESLGRPDDRIHKAAPGPDRANFRSATPMGFAKAVFVANERATA